MKFLDRKISLQCPKFTIYEDFGIKNTNSYLLNKENLPYLFLGNETIYNCKNIFKLYSSLENGCSFNSLLKSLLGFNAPTLFLIKHKHNTENHVFGGLMT